MSDSRFTLTGLGLPDGEDPLGIWELDAPETSYPAAAAFSDTSPEEEASEVLVWRVALPASRHQAATELRNRLAQAKVRQANLETASRRLGNLSTGIAFSSAASLSQSSRPESALMAEVMAFRGSAVAFDAGGGATLSPVQLYEQCQDLLTRFRRLVQYYARVETSVGGRLVALAVVDWSGDYDVTWQQGVSEADMALHLDTVRLALATRQAWLRLVSVVASGALSLSIKASVPGGQFLLIPAVYRYVRDVLKELEQVQVGTVSS